MPEEKKKEAEAIPMYPACPFPGLSFMPVPKEKSLEDPSPFRTEVMTFPCVPGQCPMWVPDPDSEKPEDGDCPFRILGIAAQEIATTAATITDFLDDFAYWQLPELIYAILHKWAISVNYIAPGEFDDFGKKKAEAEEAEGEEDEDEDEDDEEPEEEPPVPPPAPAAPAPAEPVSAAPEPRRRGRRPRTQ